jgi:hypothetical protein
LQNACRSAWRYPSRSSSYDHASEPAVCEIKLDLRIERQQVLDEADEVLAGEAHPPAVVSDEDVVALLGSSLGPPLIERT